MNIYIRLCVYLPLLCIMYLLSFLDNHTLIHAKPLVISSITGSVMESSTSGFRALQDTGGVG